MESWADDPAFRPSRAGKSLSGSFAQDQVEAAKYELAKGTNLVNYIASRSELLNSHSEVPKGEKYFTSLLVYARL